MPVPADTPASAREPTCLVTVSSPSLQLNAWAATLAEAEALAEAFHDARPHWRIAIDGKAVVFSCDGKVVDLVAAGHKRRRSAPRAVRIPDAPSPAPAGV
jgi:hypothetical protein